MTILFAIDLTEPEDIIRTVEEMAERLDAQLLVLHVDRPVEEMPGTYIEPMSGAGAMDPYAVYDPSMQEEISAAREHAFYSFIYSHFNVSIRPALREGRPADVIIEDAHHHEVDMIVLGKRHHPVLETLLLGSTSRKVVEKTDIPTLLVPIPSRPKDQSSKDLIAEE